MNEVYVYIYDLSNGLAKMMSLQLLGKQIDGIWHTGIVVFQKEIYFGSSGIESCPPEGMTIGPPHHKVFVGLTSKTNHELSIHLSDLSVDLFHGSKYDLMNHNCNTFSNVIAQWLTDKGIPDYIIDLPRNVMSTPFGNLIRPFLEKYSPAISATYNTAVTSYNILKAATTELTAVYFKEALSGRVTEFINESNCPLNGIHKDLLTEIVYARTNQTIWNMSNDLYDLIIMCTMSHNVDSRTKFVVFDVLRYRVTNDDNTLSMMTNMFSGLIEALVADSGSEESENCKCKLICNLVGLMSDSELPKDVLTQVTIYALESMRSMTNDRAASSLIRNIVLHKCNLDFETIIEIASVLIYLIVEDSNFSDRETKENVMGSIYELVINYEEIKDLAKSYDLHQKIRSDTSFCGTLHKKLQ